MDGELSLAELSESADVPPRTIRYYIAQDLLPAPLRSGRGAVYGDVHLKLLHRIRDLQAQGMTLTEVRVALLPGGSQVKIAEPVAWLEYEVAPDCVIRVRSDIAAWRHKKIRHIVAEAAEKLKDNQE